VASNSYEGSPVPRTLGGVFFVENAAAQLKAGSSSDQPLAELLAQHDPREFVC